MLAVNALSKLTADQVVTMIKGVTKVPQYMRDVFVLSGKGIAVKKTYTVPRSTVEPKWFSALYTAIDKSEWELTTGTLKVLSVSGDHVTALLEPDAARSGMPGNKVEGTWVPDTMSRMTSGKDSIAGITFPSEKMAVDLNAYKDKELHWAKSTIRGKTGLIVIATLMTGKLEMKMNEKELTRTLFHELACHAGLISAGIAYKHGDKQVEAFAKEIGKLFA